MKMMRGEDEWGVANLEIKGKKHVEVTLLVPYNGVEAIDPSSMILGDGRCGGRANSLKLA